ncbi:hypothetical protein BH11MYX3_BH11MYX3_43440 [soil metagenome]
MLGSVIRTAFATLALTTATASAGGDVLPMRGVRALERAGALVAGAEDADSLWLNPAGLAVHHGDGKRALLFDAAYIYQTVDYAPVDGSGAPLPGGSNLQPGHPVPTLAGTLGIGDRLVIGGGMTAPYGAIHRYAPDGPQRYASLDTTGSMYFVITVGAAYRVSDALRVGATIQDVVSRLSHTLVTTACTTATCDPNDASLDMALEVTQTDYLAPAGSLGLQYSWSRRATFGAMVQSPARVSGSGALTVHLPSSTQFSGAQVTGDAAALSFTLPPSVRAGIELRPRDDLRIEAAIDIELWSVPGAFTITPDHVQIENIAGGPYPLRELSIERHGKTSFAPSIGVEWHPPDMMFGAGYSYETSATPAGEVSVRAVDAAKHVFGLGGGYEADGWQIGAALGIAVLADVTVPPGEARVLEQAPLRDPSSTVPINAGRYQSRYVVGGLRFARAV